MKCIFVWVNVMRSVLSLHETPPAIEQAFKAATKVKYGLPTDMEMESIMLMEVSSLVEDIHIKTNET